VDAAQLTTVSHQIPVVWQASLTVTFDEKDIVRRVSPVVALYVWVHICIPPQQARSIAFGIGVMLASRRSPADITLAGDVSLRSVTDPSEELRRPAQWPAAERPIARSGHHPPDVVTRCTWRAPVKAQHPAHP